ncbi:MAG: Yip1 family protein [Dokdonella sp.]
MDTETNTPPNPPMTPNNPDTGAGPDFNRILARAKAILLTPKTEWPVIATEPASVAGLYKTWICVMAAIPAVFAFIKGSIIGYSMFGVSVKVPIMSGITSMILTYAMTLGLVYVLALIVDALAPNFAGEKNFVHALKLVAYAYTASWIASIGLILPVLGTLIAIAGGIYGIYLIYLGLPHTMKCPPERAGVYTAVTVVIAIVLGMIIGAVVTGIGGTGAMMSGAASGAFNSSDSNVTIDKDSTLGKLANYGAKMEVAGKRLEAAGKSGDKDAQAAAATAMLGTVMGGGDTVAALAPSDLKAFVPETLAGMKRTEYSAEQNGAMGMQMSVAHATYSDDDGQSLRLSITDVGSAKGLLGLANAVGVTSERETDDGYEKTYKQDDRLIHEEWNNQSKRGEYSVVLGDRFTVAVEGTSDDIDTIKDAVGSIDLSGLEAMRNQGVKR